MDSKTEKNLKAAREALRYALNGYRNELRAALEATPRGSGHADNDFDHLKASITQVESAQRVLWMEN